MRLGGEWEIKHDEGQSSAAYSAAQYVVQALFDQRPEVRDELKYIAKRAESMTEATNISDQPYNLKAGPLIVQEVDAWCERHRLSAFRAVFMIAAWTAEAWALDPKAFPRISSARVVYVPPFIPAPDWNPVTETFECFGSRVKAYEHTWKEEMEAAGYKIVRPPQRRSRQESPLAHFYWFVQRQVCKMTYKEIADRYSNQLDDANSIVTEDAIRKAVKSITRLLRS